MQYICEWTVNRECCLDFSIDKTNNEILQANALGRAANETEREREGQGEREQPKLKEYRKKKQLRV